MAIFTGAYRGAKSCTSGPQPGAWGAMDYFLSAHADDGGVNTGIYNCRSVRGGRTTSLHGEGRAADFGIRPYGAGWGSALADALVAYSKELGIQCVIWNRKIWSSSYPHSGWRRYSGVASHTDHIHVEFTWARASADRSATAKRFAKVLGGVKPGDVKVGGSSGGGSSFGNAKAKHKVGSRIMRKYSGGTDVTWLQKRLPKVGFPAGDVDGLFGNDTLKAVRAFQSKVGLTADGDVGPKTIKALKAAKVVGKAPKKKPARKSNKAPKFPLSRGHWYGVESSNKKNHSGFYAGDRKGIRTFQTQLKKRGWSIGVDGRFGPNTKKIVRQFQAEKGLKVDGLVGARTFKAIFEEPVT